MACGGGTCKVPIVGDFAAANNKKVVNNEEWRRKRLTGKA